MKIRVLSLDPGTNSFAYSVLELNKSAKETTKPVYLKRGFILSTINDLRSGKLLNAQRTAFEQCLHALAVEFQITHVIAERYQSRGMGGATIEHVNIMLGVLLSLNLGHTRIMPASQWKNELRRRGIDLDGMYEANKKEITPHEIDAGHIGWYGVDKAFGPFDPNTILAKILRCPREDIAAEVEGYGEMNTLVQKATARKEKAAKKRKRDKRRKV